MTYIIRWTPLKLPCREDTGGVLRFVEGGDPDNATMYDAVADAAWAIYRTIEAWNATAPELGTSDVSNFSVEVLADVKREPWYLRRKRDFDNVRYQLSKRDKPKGRRANAQRAQRKRPTRDPNGHA